MADNPEQYNAIYSVQPFILPHWGMVKMTASFQTLSNAFPQNKTFAFQFIFAPNGLIGEMSTLVKVSAYGPTGDK